MTIKGFATNQGGKSHPIHEKKGITEDQMNISVKGNNDRIIVKTNTVKRKNPRSVIINGESLDGYKLKPSEVKKIWGVMSEEERYEAYLTGLEDELPDAHFPEDQRVRARLASKVSDIDKLESTKVAGDETLGKYYADFGVMYGKNGKEGLWTQHMQVIRPYTQQDYAHYWNNLLDGMMRTDMGWKGMRDASSERLAYISSTPYEKLKDWEKKHVRKEIRELMDGYYSEYPETRNLNYRDEYITGIK